MNKLLIALGVVLLTSTSALAVELTNNENQVIQVKITEGSTEGSEGSNAQDLTIEPGATEEVCSSTCQIEVEGIGSINATTTTDKFVVEEGQITVATEPQQI